MNDDEGNLVRQVDPGQVEGEADGFEAVLLHHLVVLVHRSARCCCSVQTHSEGRNVIL